MDDGRDLSVLSDPPRSFIRQYRKNWLVSAIVSIVFTVICRFAVVRYLHNSGISDNSVYFVYERQVFSALDNFVLGMAAAAFWKQTGDRMQDYRLKLGLPVSIASTALILVWIFIITVTGFMAPLPPVIRHIPSWRSCSVYCLWDSPPAGNGFQVSASAVLRSPEPVRDLSVAYAHHYDPAGQCSMVQHHEPATLLAVLPCMVVITCVFGYFATRFIDHPASAKKKDNFP